MVQAYSDSISVESNGVYPLNNVTIEKGCSAEHNSPGTIQLNACGVYMVHMDAFAEPSAVGDITIQMSKDGVAQPQAISTVTGATGDTSTLGFETLVQVAKNNTPCPCSSPVVIQFNNTGVGVTGAHINVVVTKLGR